MCEMWKMALAKEISMVAVIVAVLPELDGHIVANLIGLPECERKIVHQVTCFVSQMFSMGSLTHGYIR